MIKYNCQLNRETQGLGFFTIKAEFRCRCVIKTLCVCVCEQVVRKCNEGARRMERTEMMYTINSQLDFKIKV